MKKLFLFTVALLTSLMVGATIHEVYPNSPQGSDNIRRTLRGDYGAINNGDTLRLADGEYTESESITIDKAITLRAAEGAKPIVKINKWIIAAAFEVDGVEFTNLETDYMFRTSANLDATITLKNCYMHGSSSPFVYTSSNTLAGLVIDNCIFANNTRAESGIILSAGEISNFEMRNSTIYNITGKYAVRVKGLTSAVVDHCTFYNCGETPLVFGETAATNISVSNTTFSNPALVAGEAMIFYQNGVANNCVYFNTSGCANWMATKTNTINADPLFADPANGDFNFSVFSPLCFAATDGTHIGDPRWTMVSEEGVDLPATLDKSNVGATSADMTYYGESGEYFDFGPEKSQENKSRWASWVVNIEKGTYKVTADVEDVGVGYNLQLEIINTTTGNIDKTFATEWKVADFGTLNLCDLTSGQYIVRLKNTLWGGQVKVKSLTFEYTGGAVVDAGLLPNDDAVLVGKVARDENNNIKSSGSGDVPTAEFFYWNVNFTEIGDYTVSINVAEKDGGGSSGHIYQVFINDADQPATKEKGYSSLAGECNLTNATINIPIAGVYQIKIVNNQEHSSAMLHSFTLTHAGGGVVGIPGTLLPADAMLSEKAFIDNDTIIFAPRGAEGFTPDGWAKWNVRLENDAICAFTAKCYVFNDNGSTFQIKVFNAENEVVYQKSKEIRKLEDIEVEINLESTLLPAGDYVIQMQNTVEHSKGRLMSVVVVLVITDDSDIDFTAYAGQTVNVQLQRTFKANMYNPICLPFGVDHSVLQSILKCETSYLLKSSSLEGQKLYVELEASQYNDIYNGSPYMIKPSEDVVNPLFTNVKIMGTPQASSSEKGVLKLQGSFIKQTIDKPQNALLVGANNTLFFPNDETPYIKSMRAYFILVGQAAKAPIKAACFREPGNAPTWMPIVGAETEKPNGKFIRDGRFVIVREGKEYNAQGIEL